MGCNPWRFVEHLPPAEIVLDGGGKVDQHAFDAQMVNQTHHVLDAYKGDKGKF